MERLANERVRQAIVRDERRNMPIDEARKLGAMALFGEKYGDEVRVIRYGDSVELCGGTHVENTGNIGMIKIVGESSIAAGIRRIEAITGARVEDMIDEVAGTLRKISSMFNNAPNVLNALTKAIEENATLKKEVQEAMVERANALTAYVLENAQNINGIIVASLTGVRVPDIVKNVAMGVKRDSPENTVFIGTTKDAAGKPLVTVAVTDDLVAGGINASNLARIGAKAIKGGGGGQPGFAQAGGKESEGLVAAAELIINELKK